MQKLESNWKTIGAVQKSVNLGDLEKKYFNAPILSIGGVDTAENEALEVC